MTKEEILKMVISRVEKEIRDTPYDKASEHHHGRLKAKLSKLKEELYGVVTGGGGGGIGYSIKHSGDATAVLVGLPSVGKSTLLNVVTNADSKVGNYDFTTLGVIPGMMEYMGISVQILDLPGLLEGASKNKGFGKKVLSVIRASDLVILMTDGQRLEWISKMEDELYKAGIRLGQAKPRINFRKTSSGAIQVVDPYKGISEDVVVSVCKEMGLANAMVQFEEKITDVSLLIDALTKSRVYLPVVKIINKTDQIKNCKRQVEKYALKNNCILMSAEKKIGIDEFRDMVWKRLGLVRVYLKRERNKVSDKDKPLIIKNSKTLADVLTKISQEMRADVKSAYIWGENARFPGQKVSFSFPVFDEMEVWFGR